MPVTTTHRTVFAMTCACAASGWTIARRHGSQMTVEAAHSTVVVAVEVARGHQMMWNCSSCLTSGVLHRRFTSF